MNPSLPDRTIRPVLWCLAGLVLGGLVVASITTVARERLAVENARLRAELTALTERHTTMLRRLEDLERDVGVQHSRATRAAALTSAAQPAEDPGASARHRDGLVPGHLTLADLPPGVQRSLAEKAGPLDATELELLTEDGRLLYQVQGLTADGRRVGLRVSSDGAIMTGKSEVTVDTLPEVVRAAVAQGWGALDVQHAREILQGDQAHYELGGQLADGRQINLRLAAEGTLLRAETEVLRQDLPPPVHNAITATLGEGATPSIREILEDQRLTYEVGVKTESRKTRLVLGDDGTVVGLESWSRPPKPPD